MIGHHGIMMGMSRRGLTQARSGSRARAGGPSRTGPDSAAWQCQTRSLRPYYCHRGRHGTVRYGHVTHRDDHVTGTAWSHRGTVTAGPGHCHGHRVTLAVAPARVPPGRRRRGGGHRGTVAQAHCQPG